MLIDVPTKKSRVDGQMTGLAGEFFVAAELLKLGLQTSITFGNAKSIDLLAHCAATRRNFSVQVKALRSKNWFLLNRDRVMDNHIYVFVILNEPGDAVQYFVVPGADLRSNLELFGSGFDDPKMPGVYPTSLAPYANLPKRRYVEKKRHSHGKALQTWN
jgi:hypothetical protein